ncbi:MAG: CehA/McbA family metallohydrolase, partial [Planctomycetota bacterium]|nr:CehA/McbA family metallohydrolase [Planctomycetota bacterium]
AARALAFTARDANSEWTIDINGQKICVIKHCSEPTEFVVPVASNIIRRGRNVLTISTPSGGDDLTVGKFKLFDRAYKDIFDLRQLDFSCTDFNGDKMACRISILTEDGEKARAHFTDESPFPSRDGVVYTNLEGNASIMVENGEYLITATRGPEYSIDQQKIDCSAQEPANIELKLKREVDTAGWLSADTHLHTLTHSGHGDASTEERIITLAGDHTEIAISTDHNKQIDYRPTMKAAGVKAEYFHITGNEVSTDIGHFNAFPLPPGSDVPDASITDWALLDKEIRSKGAKVVILNHPRWPSFEKGPFGVEKFDQATGTFGSGIELPVDAIELINSDDEASPFDVSITDWFALLNAGTKVMAAGSSDSHAVYVPTGYGRTWVKSKTDNPAKANANKIAANIAEGHSSAALGLFGEVYIDGKGSGETVKRKSNGHQLRCRIAHASWADVYRVDVYINGDVVHEFKIEDHAGEAYDQWLELPLPAMEEDSWVVCVAYGKRPGPWWATEFPELYFASNPIFIE